MPYAIYDGVKHKVLTPTSPPAQPLLGFSQLHHLTDRLCADPVRTILTRSSKPFCLRTINLIWLFLALSNRVSILSRLINNNTLVCTCVSAKRTFEWKRREGEEREEEQEEEEKMTSVSVAILYRLLPD